jgi:hypothetical protein
VRALCISSLFGRLLLIPGLASPKNWHVVVVVPSRIAIKPGLPNDYFSFSQNRSALTSEKTSFLLERERERDTHTHTHIHTDRQTEKVKKNDALCLCSLVFLFGGICALYVVDDISCFLEQLHLGFFLRDS